MPVDETYSFESLTSGERYVSVKIIDDDVVESLEYINIVLESNVTLTTHHFLSPNSTQYFLFIEDNDRECTCIVLYTLYACSYTVQF